MMSILLFFCIIIIPSVIGTESECVSRFHGRCIELNESCNPRYHLSYSHCGFLQFCCYSSWYYPIPYHPNGGNHYTHPSGETRTTPPSWISYTKSPTTDSPGTTTESGPITGGTSHPEPHNNTAECGISSINDLHRIVGGTTAQPHEYPWQVSLRYKGRHLCGGTIIDNQWILTAAHCVENTYQFYWTVAVGVHDRYSIYTSHVHRVSHVIHHGAYNKNTNKNDIALMKLEKSIDLSGIEARSACLPEEDETFGNMMCTVTGWGALNSNGRSQRYLQEVDVPIMTNGLCRHYMGKHITAGNICAGYPQGGRDACQGDSGGPLVCKKNGLWKVAGVVSWGYGCGDPNAPGVYTRVSKFAQWINHMKANY